MSKNLFDFATKELSQDAFLRWLLENYDDPVVGKASLKLIDSLASLYPEKPIDVNKITKVKTYAQMNDMDVVVDVFVGDEKYIFVIEDKTLSKEHDNQLIKYNSSIEKWKESYIYKIYYKTDFIEYKEKEHIDKAKWRIFDIDKIYDVFKDFSESKNTVLSYYSEHVIKLHSMMSKVSKKPMKEWTVLEWHTYIRKHIMPIVAKTFNDEVEIYIWKFRGSYVSFGAYYPNQFESKNKPLVEFTLRPNENITAVIHIETLKEKDNWDRRHFDKKFEQQFNDMFTVDNIPSFKRIGNKLSIATLKERIVKSDVDTTTKAIVDIIQEFMNFFNKIENSK